MATKLVTYDSFAPALEQLSTEEPLRTQSAFEGASDVSDAELRAKLAEALSVLQDEGGADGVLKTAQHQYASLLQTYLAEHPGALELTHEPAESGALEVKYDNGDLLGWARSLLEWWRKIKPEPWIPPSDTPDKIGDGTKAKIFVVGDWGTGLYGAPVIARTIAAEQGFDLLIHLGDVYYSGTPDEVKENFKAFWPKDAGKLSRAVNSNHEMYSGGEGLYKVTMPWFGQAATCWSAQTDDWLFVGMDSAYEDHEFVHDQDVWLKGLIDQKGDRRVLIFTHHQPYSLLDKQGPKLVEKLGSVLDRRQIFGWYWGHEHRCVIYDQHPAWKLYGRCVGHGGFPAYRDKLGSYPQQNGWRTLPTRNLVPGGRVLDMPNPYVTKAPDRYSANGYVTLEIDGPTLRERVHDAVGKVLLEQELA